MDAGLGSAGAAPNLVERRRFRRYHYSAPIFIRSGDGSKVRGISLEISECGTAVIATAPVKVGELVELEPVGGGVARAILRRNVGKLYGFEFLGLGSEQVERIRELCKMLPSYHVKALDVWWH
jgi:PilZ domain